MNDKELDKLCFEEFNRVIPSNELLQKELGKVLVNDDNTLTELGEQMLINLSTGILLRLLGVKKDEN